MPETPREPSRTYLKWDNSTRPPVAGAAMGRGDRDEHSRRDQTGATVDSVLATLREGVRGGR